MDGVETVQNAGAMEEAVHETIHGDLCRSGQNPSLAIAISAQEKVS